MTSNAIPTATTDSKQSRITISERRATYPLQERLKIYFPDTMARRFSDQEKNQGKMIVNGVNLLNKTSLDSDTMMHRIKQRRETHNRVERRRRDKLVSPPDTLFRGLSFLNQSCLSSRTTWWVSLPTPFRLMCQTPKNVIEPRSCAMLLITSDWSRRRTIAWESD